jgi:diguanylate cyclase (GGDEF)-like protein
LPTLAVALVGTAVVWRQTDVAVRERTRLEAVGLAEFVATNFGAVEEVDPHSPARVAHRAVTNTIRSNWTALNFLGELRIIGRDGRVRWSRTIEEEDKVWAPAGDLLATSEVRTNFPAPSGAWPWSRGAGGEVVYPLGGVACKGCHVEDSTLRTGVLHLTVDEPDLRQEVNRIFKKALGLVVLCVLFLSAILVLAVRRMVSRRIARLRAVMQRAEDGDLVVRAPALGRDELGGLAFAFNRMLARITDLKAVEIDTQRDLEHARIELELKAELEIRVRELQILYDLARTITSTLELNEILSRITQIIPTKLNVPKFSIMLVNTEGLLEVLKAHPQNSGVEGMTFAIGEGVCGRAAQLRKSCYVADLTNDPLFKLRPGQASTPHGCILAAPMTHGSDVLGVLNFERPTRADFSADEIEFFTAIADQVAMVVQNARLHERTVALTVTDPLTGIPNRRHLFQQLESELNRAQRFKAELSVLMIDIDHFKHLNDTAGHSTGDFILRQVAGILKRSIRRVDTVARYGGEEFVVLLPQVPSKEAMDVAEKLRLEIANTRFEEARNQPGGRITVSIGIATLPQGGAEKDRLVDFADAALYASKRGGRNLVTAYVQGMDLEPTRQRGPQAARRRTDEIPVVKPPA